MPDEQDALTGTHPDIEAEDTRPPEPSPPQPSTSLPPPSEPPPFAPVVVRERVAPNPLWIMGGAVVFVLVFLLIGLQHMYMMREMRTISDTQTGLKTGYSENKIAATVATQSAKDAATKADTVQRDMQTATLALTSQLADTSKQIAKSRSDITREIQHLNRRIDTLETRSKPEPPRMGIFAPPPKYALPQPPGVVPSTPAAHKTKTPIDDHHHEVDTGATPPPGTVVLNGRWNLIDTETHQPVDVIPFAHNAGGIMVHDLQDGKDHLVKSDGTWSGKVE